jgi:hypothetical protein
MKRGTIEEYHAAVKEMEDKGIKPTEIKQPKEEKLPYNELRMRIFEDKIKSIIKDYKEFHAAKGRGIKFEITLTKPNHADVYTEKFPIDKDLNIEYHQQIGTQGAYSPIDPIYSVRV